MSKVKKLRPLWFLAVVVMALPQLSRAEVDCSAVTRIERVQTTFAYLRNNPLSDTNAYHRAILIRDLTVLQMAVVRRALNDHTNQTDIDHLNSLISTAQTTKSRLISASTAQFAISLRTDDWRRLLLDASKALSHMPCGQTLGVQAGDEEGREINENLVNQTVVTAKEHIIENPVQAAGLSLLTLIAIAVAFRQAFVWFRFRTILNQRRSKRFATHIESQLMIDENIFEAEILNLNCNGAKVRYWNSEPLPPVLQVGVFIAGTWHLGSQVWSNKHYFGIKFDKPLPIPLVRELADAHRTDGLGRPK